MSWKITGYSSKHLVDALKKIQKVSTECVKSLDLFLSGIRT